MAASATCSTPILSNSNREQWGKASFWGHICQDLVISKKSNLVRNSSRKPIQSQPHRLGLIQQGYARVDDALDSSLIGKLKAGATALQQAGYPASFLILFDETWELANQSDGIMKDATHEANRFNFDILAWYIESRGFSPHRDRQPDNTPASFHPDGQAKFVTHWVALSEATPENSCLYMIPKTHDPGYMEGDDEAEDPLQRALPNKGSFQHIRSFPRSAGTSLLFTHRIIHWGSARDESSTMPPRIAISFVCSDPSYEKPYLEQYSRQPSEESTLFIAPSFPLRLLLVCAQLLIYYQRLDLPRDTIQACYQYCKDNQDELEKSYRQKVFLEYINAMKEEKSEPNLGGDFVKAADNNEDEEEAMLEEMLNAEKGQYGEFEDDFDETNHGYEGGGNYVGDRETDEEEDEEDEGVSIFGKRQSAQGDDSSSPKRRKASK
jgi:Phytanoyl-CoA dioxygenase (PhyH)